MPESLALEAARRGLEALDQALTRRESGPRLSQAGQVSAVSGGVARVGGLLGARAEEVVRLGRHGLGVVLDLQPDGAGVALLSRGEGLAAGQEVRRTDQVVRAPVGPGLLGRVVDPLGRPLDGGGPVDAQDWLPAERPAPGIMDRAPVSVPLQFGLKVVDAMIPVGRGQRELILGDRQTGKTAVALDAMLNQAGREVVCVYCGVGKRGSALKKVVEELDHRGALANAIVVAASEEDPPGLQFYAPYCATTMAEYFMAQGRDVLIVYDDLTRHARAYREISLLLRRPPGREAYPGDIFYIHSRLLERSTHLRPELGGGSLTALPIIETQAQNLSAYIPTNLVSITDGQIYLSPQLFQKGVLPAVDVGKSVSRVGGKTQLRAFRAVAGDLRLAYSQFEELEGFARFGTRLDETTRQKLDRGRRVREVLRQPQYSPLTVPEQVAVLVAVGGGVFDPLELDQVGPAQAKVRQAVTSQLPELCQAMLDNQDLSAAQQRQILEVARQALGQESSDPAPAAAPPATD